MEYYEKSYDRVTTKNEVPLAGVNRIFHKVTTTDDPIIRKVCAVKSDRQMKIKVILMVIINHYKLVSFITTVDSNNY